MRPEVFSAQMAFLAETRVPVKPLHAVRDTPGAVALTFDDGFQNFYEHAFPAIERFGFAATVFVVSGHCDGRNDWPSQPGGVPAAELMRWSQVEEVSRAGIDIGSHTVTHPYLGRLPAAQVDRELSDSRAAIEDRIGRPVRTFAYPYGESTPAVRAAVGSRFDWACGTRLAYLSPSSDPVNLPRIDMYYLQNWFWFRGLGSPRGETYLAARALLRGLRQAFV
jgi:peptidoglycan/xylan/chitin deacetylase (PgdA/CDA1 family)